MKLRLFLLYEEYLETKIKNITGLDNTEQASLSSINYHIGRQLVLFINKYLIIQ